MKTKKYVLISDFDGTITRDDFFNMVCTRLLRGKDALAPWRAYLAGRITHLDALNGIFAQIRLSQKEMDKFIATIPVDRAFFTTLKLCKKLKIPLYICSAGSDYYIKKRLGKYIKEYNITLLANGGEYAPATGLRLSAPPKISPFYDRDLGVSKKKLVQMLGKQGYFTIYAGDGRPDILAAQAADAVFARDALAHGLETAGKEFYKLKSFSDVNSFLKETHAN